MLFGKRSDRLADRLRYWCVQRLCIDASQVWLLFLIIAYYLPQRSCEGYVFTYVCLSTGGWYPSMPGNRSLGEVCSKGECGPGGICSGGVCSWGGSGPRGSGPRGCPKGVWSGGCLLRGGLLCYLGDPPKADGYCCRGYASYWNAFSVADLRGGTRDARPP